MTMPVPFDTHAYIKTLIEAGFPEDQAEAHAQALTEALVNATVAPSEHVLLKVEFLARMDGLRSELLVRMDGLRSELLAGMDGLRNDLLASMEGLRSELLTRMDELRSELDKRIGRLEQRIGKLEGRMKVLYWMVGATLLLQAVTLAALVPLLFKLLR